MAGLFNLAGQSLGPASNFNWLWLIELLVCIILVLFFLFYFNRLFATLVSYGLRAYTWHQYRVYIDFQALQISLLGGRIFFKGLRYHGQNETILVQNGFVTWRYWLRNVRQTDLVRQEHPVNATADDDGTGSQPADATAARSTADEETGSLKKVEHLPSRIAVSVWGLEWFVYNRTPAYDAIISTGIEQTTGVTRQENKTPSSDHPADGKLRANNSKSTSGVESVKLRQSYSSSGSRSGLSAKEKLDAPGLHPADTSRVSEAASLATSPDLLILRILPVYLECTKGSIILGNENTRALVVATFDKADGHVDASAAGPRDLYKQVFDFAIEHPVVQLKPNPEFREPQSSAAERVLFGTDFARRKRPWWAVNLHLQRRRRKAWRNLRSFLPGFQRSVESLHHDDGQAAHTFHPANWQDTQQDQDRWHGLRRYLDEDELDDHEGWAHVDYARFSTILDCPNMHLTFYWDTPGPVAERHAQKGDSGDSDINGSPAPGYGLDLVVKGGHVDYGPWTDRLRAEIQNAFFPNGYKTPEPAERLNTGELRQSTKMLIRVTIEDEVTLRIPTRESSKDWRWKGRASALHAAAASKKQRERKHFRFKKGSKSPSGPDVRPFGWFSFSVAKDSTVRYEMDMLPSVHGFRNTLELDLRSTRVTSSVNHGLLWRCQSHRLSCDLSNPLVWNALHSWSFNVQNDSLELFMLRDHMFLLTDMITDFTSGPGPDYMTFVPFEYRIGLAFKDLKLFLNANDANIIDGPSDLEDNMFIVLGLQELHGSVTIPLRNYRPAQSSVLFKATGKRGSLELMTPVWNTLRTFVDDVPVATLKDLGLNGSYNYCAGTSPELSDSLVLDITGGGTKLILHGFLIRYFMVMKENYFGEDVHFKTLEEHQDAFNSGRIGLGPHGHQPVSKENDLDTILTVKADHSCVLLPANVYSRKDHVRFDVLLVEADMRFTNYYMDLEVLASPLEAALGTNSHGGGDTSDEISNTQMFVDGLSVSGHRLFGAPATEPTYSCHWDFQVGDMIGECSMAFIRTLMLAGRAFAFTFDDDENALPKAQMTVVHDITFVQAHVHSIRIWALAENAAILLESSDIDVNFDDWAGPTFSKHIRVTLPDLLVAVVDGKSAARAHEHANRTARTLACFQTSAEVRVLDRKAYSADDRALQQKHVRLHDQRTQRAGWLLRDPYNQASSSRDTEWARRPPTISVPSMPRPLLNPEEINSGVRGKLEHCDTNSLRSSRSSFLTLPVSLQDKGGSKTAPRRSLGSLRGSKIRESSNRNQLRRTSDRLDDNNKFSTSNAVTFSSPWTSPYFTLQSVQPDRREVPELPPASKLPKSGNESTPQEEDTPPSEDTASAKTAIMVDFMTGLTGFLMPEAFVVVASLLKNLQVDHPIDLLDALQIDTMSEIVRNTSRAAKPGQTIDLGVWLPVACVRMVTPPDPGSDIAPSHRDQYDLTVLQSRVALRLQLGAATEDARPSSTQMLWSHVRASDIAFKILEKLEDGLEGMASVDGRIMDLIFWLGSQEQTRSRLQVRSIESAVWGQQIEYLASLIQRTGAVAQRLVEVFSIRDPTRNIRHLIYHLTLADSRLADPIFLTRPSYVLRSAEHHLRLHDSWKIMSRLRHIYNSLPEQTRGNINRESTEGGYEIAQAAEEHVVSSFDQWRSWDHERSESIPLMNRIFQGTPMPMPMSAVRKDEKFRMDASIGQTILVLDPGPQQSEVHLGDINTSVFSHISQESGERASLGLPTAKQKLSVETYFSRIMVNVNWELAELVLNTLEQISISESEKEVVPATQLKIDRTAGRPEMELLVSFGTDDISLTLGSMNLDIVMAADRLAGSFAYNAGSVKPDASSLLLASSRAWAKVKSKKRTLFGWRLALPGLFTSTESGVRGGDKGLDVRVAGNCQRLRFDLREDPLGILDVARQVIHGEVVRVLRTVSLMRSADKGEARNDSPTATLPPEVHVAFFLDEYRLTFTLLPQLYYQVSGRVARTSIIPLDRTRSILNFDLRGHEHVFRSEREAHSPAIPTLKIPHVNGKARFHKNGSDTFVDVQTTVEQIRLEAAAVRACVDMLNTPEVARLVLKLRSSVPEVIKEAENSFGLVQQRAPTKQSPPVNSVLHYRILAALVGTDIHLTAAATEHQDYSAEVDFMLGLTTLRCSNRKKKEDGVYEQPQFDLKARQINLRLRRKSSDEDTVFGTVELDIEASGRSEVDLQNNVVRIYHACSSGLRIDVHPETVVLALDVATFVQGRLKSFSLTDEAKQFSPLRRLTTAGLEPVPQLNLPSDSASEESVSTTLLSAVYALDMAAIQVRWLLPARGALANGREVEDLTFSIRQIDLRTKREGSARLAIMDLQLQMVPRSRDPIQRTSNSALLPEVVFNVAYLSTKHDRRLAFQAAGKALDLRLASDFILPASALQDSFAKTSAEVRQVKSSWASEPVPARKETTHLLGTKRFGSLLLDADFAGAVVNIKARKQEEPRPSVFGALKGERHARTGRYGQVVSGDAATEATMQSPGVALKVQYKDNGKDDPTLSAEIKVAASKNVLYPSVVPLILEISSSITEIVGEPVEKPGDSGDKAPPAGYLSDARIASGDPAAILGRCKLNVGLWIREQEFSLSCQPIARVAATARFDNIFMSVNTVQNSDADRFFALVMTFNALQASVQHVYSRESTASFEVDSIVVSMINSKHVSSKNGLSAIMNISPMSTEINAKQLQDFLLFREIWYPQELRDATTAPAPTTLPSDTNAYVVQRYQQITTAGAFPWNAVISLQELRLRLDLGQAVGTSVFTISKLWASSKKTSDWEQNLCIGFDQVGIDSTGRMSGFVELRDFRVRTSIRWPLEANPAERAPLVQGSLAFEHLRIKAAFDYQPFGVADIASFEFLIYNIRQLQRGEQDRLVGILTGDKVQVFCTPTSAAQALGLYQAVERLIQEKEAAYETSLRELDRFMRRKSVFPSSTWTATTDASDDAAAEVPRGAWRLHTDVVVTLEEVNLGAFPSTFFDSQIFKVEATDAQARFAVAARDETTHSSLGMTLGQLRVALSSVSRTNTEALGDVSVSDVIQRSTGSRGGTILKVPRVVATMQTWQAASSHVIEYIFKSTFEGKVDVGWNYSRIGFIREMWSAHVRALAHRLGKPLTQSAVKITTDAPSGDGSGSGTGQEKITAVVHVPQSKFDYVALEPPIIDTPQLRDMGEATPPLEWVGLHRDRLPNVTHQIIIVTLLEVAKEVEDAYSKILGAG